VLAHPLYRRWSRGWWIAELNVVTMYLQ